MRRLRVWMDRLRPRPSGEAERVEIDHPLAGKVRAAIDECRPLIRADGGDIELVDIDAEQVVHVRLSGACKGCPASSTTLQWVVEQRVLEAAPGIRAVVNDG